MARSSAFIGGEQKAENIPVNGHIHIGPPDSLTERVIGAIMQVSNTLLGAGFLEKVYERALLRQLSLRGIRATTTANTSGNTMPTSWSKTCW